MVTFQLHLIRTGSTAVSDERTYVGQSDPPLSAAGRRELQKLLEACEYPRVEKVYASPLQRCVQTAGILFPGLPPVPQEKLMDMHLGSFQGKSFQELRSRGDFSAWLNNSAQNPPPGGETPVEFTARIVAGLAGVFADMMEQHVHSAAAVVHAGVIMTLLGAIGLPKLPLPQWMTANGTGFTLLMTPQMWMRDQSVEVYSLQPLPREQESPAAGTAGEERSFWQ